MTEEANSWKSSIVDMDKHFEKGKKEVDESEMLESDDIDDDGDFGPGENESPENNSDAIEKAYDLIIGLDLGRATIAGMVSGENADKYLQYLNLSKDDLVVKHASKLVTKYSLNISPEFYVAISLISTSAIVAYTAYQDRLENKKTKKNAKAKTTKNNQTKAKTDEKTEATKTDEKS